VSIIVHPDVLTRPGPRRGKAEGPTPVGRALLFGLYYLLVVFAVAVPVAGWASAYHLNLFDEYRSGYAAGTTGCARAVEAAFPGAAWPAAVPAEVTAFLEGCEQRQYGLPDDPWTLRNVLND
jgi:hypothetical protein